MTEELQPGGPQPAAEPQVPLTPYGKVMAVTSGKGGVGKTFVSATWPLRWPNAA